MTPDMRKRREAEIVDKEKAAKDFQRQNFWSRMANFHKKALR
jgi:hypothetical protein